MDKLNKYKIKKQHKYILAGILIVVTIFVLHLLSMSYFQSMCIKVPLFDNIEQPIILAKGESYVFHLYRGDYDIKKPKDIEIEIISMPKLDTKYDPVTLKLNGVKSPYVSHWEGNSAVLPMSSIYGGSGELICGDNIITLRNDEFDSLLIKKVTVGIVPDKSYRCGGIYIKDSCTQTEFYSGCVTKGDINTLNKYCVPEGTVPTTTTTIYYPSPTTTYYHPTTTYYTTTTISDSCGFNEVLVGDSCVCMEGYQRINGVCTERDIGLVDSVIKVMTDFINSVLSFIGLTWGGMN